MFWLLAFAIVILAWWVVAIATDELMDRWRPRLPERWTVHIPGRFPSYVRQDYARARKAMARTLNRTSTSTPED